MPTILPKDASMGSNGGVAITPSDSADVETGTIFRGIYVGVAGHIKFTNPDDSTITRSNVPVGLWPWRFKRVWNSVTTATNLVAER